VGKTVFFETPCVARFWRSPFAAVFHGDDRRVKAAAVDIVGVDGELARLFGVARG